MTPITQRLGLAVAAGMLALLSGCVTPGLGGFPSPGGAGYPYPGGGGYGQPGYPGAYANQMQGTVERVDAGYNRLLVYVDDPRYGRGQAVQVRYDQRTRLVYQGREHAVEGLERGDVIRFDVVQSGSELWTRQIEVVRNVREGGYGGGYGDAYGNDLRGQVGFVDTRARTIQLEGGGYGAATTRISYDARTIVEYQGRRYTPENLQRGDIVRVQARQLGYGQWLAERILVEQSARRGW